jgi:hypothetical protein
MAASCGWHLARNDGGIHVGKHLGTQHTMKNCIGHSVVINCRRQGTVPAVWIFSAPACSEEISAIDRLQPAPKNIVWQLYYNQMIKQDTCFLFPGINPDFSFHVRTPRLHTVSYARAPAAEHCCTTEDQPARFQVA